MDGFFDLSHRSTRKGKYSAIASVVITIGALIAEVIYIILSSSDAPAVSNYSSSWDADYLSKSISFRNKILNSQIAAIICFCIALGLIMHTIFTVKKLYRNDKTWFKNGLLICFGLALVFATIQTLQFVGASVGARNVSSIGIVPYEALVAIQVSWLLAISMNTFLLGAQILLLAFGIICTFVLTYRAGGEPKYRLTIRHGIFGLIVAFIGIFAFIFQMIDSMETTSSIPAILNGITTLLFSYVMFPSWLIWLGVQLGTREIPDDAEQRNLVTNQL